MPDDDTPAGGILVTGASSGIGEAVAIELAAHGFTVGCLSRRGTGPPGDRLIGIAADVNDEPALEAAVTQMVDASGALAGVVNAAGQVLDRPSAELDADSLRGLLDTNVVSAMNLSRFAYPHLRDNPRGGLIVNVGSFYDRLGVPRQTAYVASKAALGALTRCLAVEWARDQIRVLNVAPGYVLTGLNDEYFGRQDRLDRLERRIPVGAIGQPQEVASFICRLFTDRIGFLTGETIYIDGGHGIVV